MRPGIYASLFAVFLRYFMEIGILQKSRSTFFNLCPIWGKKGQEEWKSVIQGILQNMFLELQKFFRFQSMLLCFAAANTV